MDVVLVTEDIVRVQPSRRHTGTVIFLHGLGQSNLTWKIVVTEALAPKFPHLEFILPQAPKRPVSFNQGQLRPSWFNVSRLPPDHNEYDETAIAESIALIENLVLSQVHNGIDSRRIALIGFSQGAALGLMVSLTTLYELGGVASLSGWIPWRARYHMMHSAPNLPILWCHGAADSEIPISYAEDALSFLYNHLRVPSSQVQFNKYPNLAHTINDEELNDLITWLQRALP